MNKNTKDKKINVTGLILTGIVTLGFIWASLQWFNRYDWPTQLSRKDIQANEIQTFKNLRRISGAQENYKQTDRNGDGKKSYAKFFVHLWTSVNTESDPVLIDLIPKELAFAMGPSLAIDGYYFEDLHSRTLPTKEQTRKLDYQNEWAITAITAAVRQTGSLIFIADNSKDIFVKTYTEIPSQYPHDPLANGWTKIGSIEQLKDFQKTLNRQ
jgi:hypothetical protein